MGETYNGEFKSNVALVALIGELTFSMDWTLKNLS